MRQIIQNLKTGQTILEDVPAPVVQPGSVLIRTTKTLVSLGTERMLVEFGKANLIAKARQQPEKVAMVLDKIKSEGLVPTLEAVFSKLNLPLPLGYCNVGEVVEVGDGVQGIVKGDRVASNGPHAEFVCVPENLVAKIPDGVTDSEATFTVIGAIGLQGIRLLNPTLGESIVVMGLGLIGLLTADLLIANGCQVIGFDFDKSKVEIAKARGIEAVTLSKQSDPIGIVQDITHGNGADGVIITASNSTNEIISQAAQMSRKRGRIILVGVIGLNLSRSEFYEKELTFQVSCSYGPGRYDPNYENKGIDYPLPFVRWTEKRNFEAVLKALAQKSIDVVPMISKEVGVKDFSEIYANMADKSSIASLIKFDSDSKYDTTITLRKPEMSKREVASGLGIIGAGNFTNATVLPSLKKAKANLMSISSAGGLNAKILAKKFGIASVTSSYHDILANSDIGLVVITTRHNLHSKMTIDALKARKHVFVEKPLALTEAELGSIKKEVALSGMSVTVGFNRRFSPHMTTIKKALGESATINITATMNAGFIPSDSWVQDLSVGGGRIIGEACHLIDCLIFLTGSTVKSVCMNALGESPSANSDNASILLKFENGSNGVINYFSNGSKSYSKERFEIYSQGKTIISDNFRETKAFGFKGFKKLKTVLDKGHNAQFTKLVNFIGGGETEMIPFSEIENASLASIKALESLKKGSWMNV